jgi:PST family polysaccharide transporter
MIVSRLTTRGIDFATLMILGRLLSPADFGLVAIAMSVMLIVEAVSELPTAQALMRLSVLNNTHYDTGFTFAILRAFALAMTLVALAWPIAALYGDDRLIGLLCTMWLAPAARSLGSPVLVDFYRKFDFRPVVALEVGGKSLAFITAVGLAWCTASYWSILAGTVVAPLSMAVLSYFVAPYTPRLSFAAWRDFSSFFGWSTASQLVRAINWQMDQLILARFISPVQLGRFAMADNLSNVPSQVLITQVANPLVVAFSRIRTDTSRLASAYLHAAASIIAIGVPTMVGLSMLAEPVIRFVLGKQWLEAAPILQGLSLSLIPYFFTSAVAPLFMAMNRTKIFLQLSIIEFLLKIVLIFPAIIYFGIKGVVGTRLVTVVLVEVYSMFAVRQLTGVSVTAQLVSPWRSILGAIAMAMLINYLKEWLASRSDPISLALALAFVVTVSAAAYCTVLLVLWLLAGKPDGPESKAMALLNKICSR